MIVRLLTNVIVDGEVVPKGKVLENRPDLLKRGLAEEFDPNAKVEPVISDEEVEAAVEEGDHTSSEDVTDSAEDSADEKTSEEEQEAQEPEQRLMASYSGGGWYELSDGTKCRRKDLPENVILAV